MKTLRRAASVILSAALLLGVAPNVTQAADMTAMSKPKGAEYLRNVYRVTGNLRSLSGLQGVSSIQRGSSAALRGSARIRFSAPLDEVGFNEKRADLVEAICSTSAPRVNSTKFRHNFLNIVCF